MSQPAKLVHHDIQAEIISHAVWLYFRFHLSLRDVQDLLAERGLVVSHESIRQWCDTFGPTFAAGLRKRRHGQATSGTVTSCCSRSTASATGCGEPSIRRG